MDNGQYGQNITDSGVKTVTLPEAGAQSSSISLLQGGLLFPTAPQGTAGMQPTQKCATTHHGRSSNTGLLRVRNTAMTVWLSGTSACPAGGKREGAVRPSLVRGTAQAHLRAPQHETGDVEVRFLWGATGGSWALQRQADTKGKLAEVCVFLTQRQAGFWDGAFKDLSVI